jgi:hypothetical protein
LNASPTGAATPGDASTGGNPFGYLGDVGTGFNAVSGLTSGNPIGQASGALSAAQLSGNLFGSNAASTLAGNAAPFLGLYSGLQSGTPTGDLQAAGSAAGIAGQAAGLAGDATLAGTLGAAAGMTGIAGTVLSIPMILGALTANQGEGPVTLMNEALGQSPTLGAADNAPGLLNPVTGQPFANPEYQIGQNMQAAGKAGNAAQWNQDYLDLMSTGGTTGGITQMR